MNQHLDHWTLALAGALIVAAPRPAAPQTAADTLRVAEAVRLAASGNPMLRAARLQAQAATERIGPAGTLPDPQFQLGLSNRMLAEPFSTMDPMTMDEIRLMQMIPWPGKLGAARRSARHHAAALTGDADERGRMLAAEVRMAYYELALADRALGVMERTRTLLREFQNVATTMYAVGSGVQQDVLRSQVEVARMSEEIVRMRQERIAAAARLNALIGRPVTTAIGAVELPLPDDSLPPPDTLIALALQRRPALVAGAERVAAAEAALAAARRELWPDLQLALSYQRRAAFPDMATVMIGFSLPVYAAGRQLPMRREMAAMRDMAAAELESQRSQTAARVAELRARVNRDRELIRLYQTSILPQAGAAVQAALAGYRVGRVTFMTLVDDQMTVNRYQIESYRLAAEYHQAVGEIEALTGPVDRRNP